MSENIAEDVAEQAAEQIGCTCEEIDASHVAHTLETWGSSIFPEDCVGQIQSHREDGRVEAVYRVGRLYYLRSYHHGYIESADWRHLLPSTALIRIEEWLEDEKDEEMSELARPDDPDSIEDLLLSVDVE